MSKIFFLTNTFPFLTGEQFIETEIKYLADSNSEVIVFPLKVGGEARIIPSNIKLDTRLSSCNKVSLKSIINLFCSKYLYSEILLKPSVLFSFYKLKKTLHYVYVAENIAYELAKFIKKSKEKHILIYSYWATQSAFAATILKKQDPTLRAVTRCHRFDLYRERNKGGFMPMDMRFLNELEAVFPCSVDGAEYLVREYNVLSNKVITTRLGTLDYGYGKGFNKREKLHIVSCSYLVPVKRVHLIMEALTLLQGSIEITWTHIGGGVLKNDLQKLARNKLNNVRVNWMGEVSNHDVLNFFKTEKIDCFINVSSSEGVPVSIMEATSFGLPVVALDVGGVCEIVNQDNGKLLRSNATAQEIAEAITAVCQRNSDDFRKSIKKQWCEKYSADNNYPVFISILNKLVNREG